MDFPDGQASVMWECPVLAGEERGETPLHYRFKHKKNAAFFPDFFPLVSYGKLVKCWDVELSLL